MKQPTQKDFETNPMTQEKIEQSLSVKDWLIKEGYPEVMPMTLSNLANIIDRYSKQEMKKFAEWCSLNDWVFLGKDNPIQPNKWEFMAMNKEAEFKTTDELLSLYLQQPTDGNK